MIDRRLLLSSAAIVTLTTPICPANALDAAISKAYEKLNFTPASPPSDSTAAGDNPTHAADVARAFQIVSRAPRNAMPIDVANYFSGLTTRSVVKYGNQQYLFREEWPAAAPFNPLIASFFGLTQTLPSGNSTSWCAAFVNACLWLTDRFGTDNAGSASFRHLAKPLDPTRPPRTGDVAVFKDQPPAGDAPNFSGHVGFYVAPEDVANDKYPARPVAVKRYKQAPSKYIYVLGGNQGGGDPGSTGGIKVAPQTKDGSLILLGFVPIETFKLIEVT